MPILKIVILLVSFFFFFAILHLKYTFHILKKFIRTSFLLIPTQGCSSIKNQTGSILGFVDYAVSVLFMQPCHCYSKAATGNTQMNKSGQVLITLDLWILKFKFHVITLVKNILILFF